jgi:hypothetical protein
VKGYVRASSVGSSTLQFTSYTLVSGHVAARPAVIMEPAHLLPPGQHWDIPVSWKSWLGLGWYTVHATLVYNVTDQRTADVALSRTIVVINPFWFAVPVLLAGFVTVLVFLKRRKATKRMQPGP